jgi:hypothetical protein
MPGFTRRRCICGGTYESSAAAVTTPHRVLDAVPCYVCKICGSWAVSRSVIERVEALFAELPEDPATLRVTSPDTAAHDGAAAGTS